MVLTNFECWAHGGPDNLSANPMVERRGNSVDLFNPAVLQQACHLAADENGFGVNCGAETHVRSVSHFSSNGYYGFVACSGMNSEASLADVANPKVRESYINNESASEIEHGAIFPKRTVASDDTVMDVEQQEHMVFLQECASGSVVNSMFSENEPAFAVEMHRENGENNGLRVNPRKRRFGVIDKSEQLGTDIMKKLRHEDESSWLVKSDNHLFSFSKTTKPLLLLGQGGISPEDISTQMVLNSANSDHAYNEQESAPSILFHRTDQVKLNKVNATNAKYVDISRCIASHMI